MQREEEHIHNQLVDNSVISTPYLLDKAIRQWGMVQQNIVNHYNSYLQNFVDANAVGPIEKHPYIDKYEQDFDLSRKFLLLGTFPGTSYFNNLEGIDIPAVNNGINNLVQHEIDFYNGHRRVTWRYLLNVQNNDFQTNTIRERLQEFDVAVSDVFYYIQRDNIAQATPASYHNIILNNSIFKVFEDNITTDVILTTSGSISSLINNDIDTVKGIRWVIEESGVQLNDVSISGDDYTGNGVYHPITIEGIENCITQQNDRIIWWIKLGNKKVKIINLPKTVASGTIGSDFFLRWVNFRAGYYRIPAPLEAELDNLIGYMQGYPDAFGQGQYVVSFWKDVYQKALNGGLHEI